MRELLFDEWWESDSGSDTTLDSCSDESDPDSRQPLDSDSEVEPRRVRKSRKTLLGVLLSTFTIVKRSRSCHVAGDKDASRPLKSQRRKLDAQIKDPWEGLPRSMDALTKALRDKRVNEVPELAGGLSEFQSLSSRAQTSSS